MKKVLAILLALATLLVFAGCAKQADAPAADGHAKNKIAIQQRDCDFERRRSGMNETCRLRRGEGYGACADEGASIAFG